MIVVKNNNINIFIVVMIKIIYSSKIFLMIMIMIIIMKSTKVQNVGTIWLSWNVVTLGLKTPLHVLGEHTGMKTELYQSNIKIQGFIYRASVQH